MPLAMPLPLQNLPNPITLNLGMDLTCVDTDGGHTACGTAISKLMRINGNPVWDPSSLGGFVGQITEAGIENWAKLNPTLPPPIRPEDMDKAIIWQASFAGMWLPGNDLINSQTQPDETRTDHPLYGVVPWGDNKVPPNQKITPYAQFGVAAASGSPWPYIYLFLLGLTATKRTLRLEWKAAGKFWSNARDLIVAPCLKAEGMSQDSFGWWPRLMDKALQARLQRAVALAGNGL